MFHIVDFYIITLSFLQLPPTVAVWPVRESGRFPIKLHEKLKWATTLRIPLKPLLAIPHVTGWRSSRSSPAPIVSIEFCRYC